MPVYLYLCNKCSCPEEHNVSVADRGKPEITCKRCGEGIMKRTIGNNGGFRLGENGSVGWAKDGYGSTYGDIENFKAGRKIY